MNDVTLSVFEISMLTASKYLAFLSHPCLTQPSRRTSCYIKIIYTSMETAFRPNGLL